MKYLQIKSKGEIDINAFTLIGASTKRDDTSKIGWYGSGLKYAIASLIRNKIEFQVFSGTKEIKFRLKNVSLKDKTFNMITVNSRQTSLTDTMGGSDWDNAFAPIREIYSNALDEDEDSIIIEADDIMPIKGYTIIYIQANDDITKLYNNLSLYFIKKNPEVLFSNSYAAVYKSHDEKHRMYRKGILCYEGNEKEKAFFNYNSKNFHINESRVLNDSYSANYTVADCWGTCEDIGSIAELVNILNIGIKCYERGLMFSYTRFSDTWKTYVKDKKFYAIEFEQIFDSYEKGNRIRLPLSLLSKLKRQFGDDIDVLGLDEQNSEEAIRYIKNPHEGLLNKVLDALNTLKGTSYSQRISNPKIRIAIFSSEERLATIKDKNIVLSQKLDTYSVSEIAKILIEENEHMLSGLTDQTRAFQNHLFNLYYEELIKKDPVDIQDKKDIFVDLTESK